VIDGSAGRAPAHRVPGDEPGRARGRASPFGAVVAALVAVPLVGLAAIMRDTAGEVERDTGHEREQVAYATVAATGPLAVMRALADERAAATAWLTGTGGMAGPPVPAGAAAREAADRAIATLRADLAAQDVALVDAFALAWDQSATLVTLRAAVDAVPDDARDPANPDAAATDDAYQTIIDAYVGACERATLALDDPDLRQGATLTGLAAAQATTAGDLTRAILRAAAGDRTIGDDQVGDLTVRLNTLRDGDQRIAGTATGGYRPLADALAADERVQGFGALVEQSLATRAVDPAAVLATSPSTGVSAYASFERRTTELFDARKADLMGAAEARERRYTMVAAATMGGAAAAVLATLVLAALAVRAGLPPHGDDGRA
jgi:hypothetical protein